ncbi:hypothetical protein HDU93_002204 [Gonapodya sp. JEL0774]|nr:hypothetical protein HDU93_002204 [Gonapodya sp. JEL0774]
MQLVENHPKDKEPMSPKTVKQPVPPPVDEQVARLENLNVRLRNQLLQSRKENEFLQHKIEQGQDTNLLQKLHDDVHFLRSRCDNLERENASFRTVIDRQAKQLVTYANDITLARAGKTGMQHGDVHVIPLSGIAPGVGGQVGSVGTEGWGPVKTDEGGKYGGNNGVITKRHVTRRRTGTGMSAEEGASGDDSSSLPKHGGKAASHMTQSGKEEAHQSGNQQSSTHQPGPAAGPVNHATTHPGNTKTSTTAPPTVAQQLAPQQPTALPAPQVQEKTATKGGLFGNKK